VKKNCPQAATQRDVSDVPVRTGNGKRRDNACATIVPRMFGGASAQQWLAWLVASGRWRQLEASSGGDGARYLIYFAILCADT
jgi:hypothetical protein